MQFNRNVPSPPIICHIRCVSPLSLMIYYWLCGGYNPTQNLPKLHLGGRN